MGVKKIVPVLAVSAALLAACGSSPPTARDLITRALPGCTQISAPTGGVSVYAQTELGCYMPDSTYVDVATFANVSDLRSWVRSQGGWCIAGDGWAAFMIGDAPGSPVWNRLERIDGGHDVSS